MIWRWIIKTIFFTQIFFANDNIEIKGDIGGDYISYSNSQNDILNRGKAIFDLKKEKWKLNTEIDFFYSQNYKKKRDLYFNELYTTLENREYTFKIGKQVLFWGELEGYNIIDVFNSKNTILDIFDKSQKKGAWSLIAKKFEENSNIEIGTKVYEEDNSYLDNKSPYYFFTLPYNKKLEINNRYSPTTYIKYNFSTDENLESDTNIIFQNGYDNKRYFAPLDGKITQYAYRVNKIMLSSNIIYNDIIFKIESSYTDIINENKMSNYRQLGFGFENGFYNIDNIDISLYLEYYYYDYLNNHKLKNVDISELYNNDIFMALRFAINNTKDSELKIGFLKDTQNNEIISKLEIKSRLIDSLVLSGEALHFSNDFKTYPKLSNHTRIIMGIKYFF
ncbi:MAG: hypothetical protein GXO60_04265 [Epsilonproteobacteria bacterium]|nr:hypothetical protein [Campylobacterota bacterium]